MQCTRMVDDTRMNVTLNGKLLDEVECVRYLRLHVAFSGDIDGKVKFRME